MKVWYAVLTHSRAESTAVHNLERQGYSTYLPLYLKKRVHSRRVDWKPAPLFPRYLFVGVNINKIGWSAIRSTIGVVHIVCFGKNPTQVPMEVIKCLQSREDDKGFVRLIPDKPIASGDKVNIIDGALGNTSAIVKEMNGENRVILLLNLMGRQIKAQTSLEHISAVA